MRYLVADDDRQFRQARRVMESGPVFVPKTVLLESEWVLRRAYRMQRAQVQAVLDGLTQAAEVELEDRDVVVRAVAAYRTGMDFADALHVASSGPAESFDTFDRHLAASARKAGFRGVGHLG